MFFSTKDSKIMYFLLTPKVDIKKNLKRQKNKIFEKVLLK